MISLLGDPSWRVALETTSQSLLICIEAAVYVTKDSRRITTEAVLPAGTMCNAVYGGRTFNCHIFEALEDGNEAVKISSLNSHLTR